MDYSQLESKIIKGQDIQVIVKSLNEAGKHIVSKSEKTSCPAATQQNSWYYDIVVHNKKPNLDRLFVIKSEGCTFIRDAKDDLYLSPSSMRETLENLFK